MNNLRTLTILTNRYFVIRHGESTANQQGLIVSSPENGVPDYGLSDNGRAQIEQSIQAHNDVGSVTQIISSDFKRARESAEIAHDLLSCMDDLNYSKSLRERFFGDFELNSNINYQSVWDNDAVDSAHTKNNAESADAVMERATTLVVSLEKVFTDEVILLVSHGDTLQILQAAFQNLPASRQRSLQHLETAEIRELVLVS